MNSNKIISIVIPIYNEEGNIKELYNRLINSLKKDFGNLDYEIICIDDGSTDKSFELLEEINKLDNNLKVIQFSRNFGHHIAITAGLDFAKGDYIVMMDGDLQDQPEEIIKLYNKLEEGYDIVYGNRINKQFSFIKKTLSKLFNLFISFLINEKIVINSTIFRVMKKQVVDNIKLLREYDRYIVGIIGWVGFKHGEQEVIHGKRIHGYSKYNIYKQYKLALNAIFSFSNYPLKFITKIGFFFVFLSILYIIYLIYNKIIHNESLLGWTSTISSIFLIGGLQIMMLGIIGEYIGRTYIESKKRPLYIINKII